MLRNRQFEAILIIVTACNIKRVRREAHHGSEVMAMWNYFKKEYSLTFKGLGVPAIMNLGVKNPVPIQEGAVQVRKYNFGFMPVISTEIVHHSVELQDSQDL